MNEQTKPIEQQHSAPATQAEPVVIYQYASQLASTKTRISLQQNLFSFLLEGEKKVEYAGASVQSKPGQFLLLSAGNCLMSEKTAGPSGTYKSILIAFDNHILADFLSRHSSSSPSRPCNAQKEPFLRFEQDDFLANYLESLRLLVASGLPTPAMRLLKLEELLSYLEQTCPGQLQKLHTKRGESSDELLIRQAVTAGIDQPVTVDELAFLCNISVSTFKRRFAKLYGHSPTKWMLEKRMQKAARLLSQEKRKASEIYDELGYENLSSFIQSFKHVYGLTPKQYQVANLAGGGPIA